MISKNLAIGIGILLLVGFGLLFMSTMTGNVITGSTTVEDINDDEYFRISDFGAGDNEIFIEAEVEDGA